MGGRVRGVSHYRVEIGEMDSILSTCVAYSSSLHVDWQGSIAHGAVTVTAIGGKVGRLTW